MYCSHTFDYFDREDGRRFIEKCHRVLRANGIIRIVASNLRGVIDEYTEGHARADEFIEQLGVLYSKSNNTLRNRLYRLIRFPRTCEYDTPRELAILHETSFNAFVKATFYIDIKDIRMIELEERTNNALIVYGRKS